MDTKIFLEGYNSKKSVNTSEGLNVELKGKRKLLPTNDVAEVISQYDQYSDERKNCNIIRLTCQVNPICSNVLFNRISEIVRDEGSPELTYINYGIYRGTSADGVLDYDIDEENGIKYKSKKLSFWSGNTLNYQSKDVFIEGISDKVNTKLSASINNNTAHTANGTSTPTSSKHPTNAIRDMQLSNCDYVYHCGLDIFNNHLIRSNTFKCVCKMPESYDVDDYTAQYNAFNTIADLMRDINGDKVVEKIIYPIEAGIPENTKFIGMHLYKYDDIYTFEDCVTKRRLDKYDGWVGFNNKPKIKTYNIFSIDHRDASVIDQETELHIERPIMYLNGGDFVDMYPDRSLYSFVPKYNKFRNRIEKNWNYCLTYPSSSTTKGFEDIIETSNNSLKALYFNENTRADNGVKQLVIYSIAKHGLAVGDYVNIYNNTVDESGNTINTKIIDNAEVSEVVDEFIFTVFNADVQISNKWVSITKDEYRARLLEVDEKTYKISDDRLVCYEKTDDGIDENLKPYYIVSGTNYVNFDDDAQNLSYKKVVNDIECEYYVRIFSKIPNFKNASGDTSSEYEIYRERESGETMVSIYQDKQYDFESHVSRLAFANNIYGDEVGEIVFTDDIDISNLKDNLGRPLSSIYLTIVKNNKGYKEWYGFDCDSWSTTEITNENVEFSHCFGKISCGIKTSDETVCTKDIQGINQLSNDSNNARFGYDIEALNGERSYENYIIGQYEIWFDTDKHYYGDLCYYDNYNAVERSIQPILHRFNTAQRESIQADSWDYFDDFIYDEIYYDDYDTLQNFTITSYTIDEANEKNEGYYYQPHYEIPIKTFDKIQTVMPDFLTMRSLVFVDKEDGVARINVLQNHYLTAGDKAMIYDITNNAYYYCTTISGESDSNRTFTCQIYNEDGTIAENLTDLFTSYDVDTESEDYEPSLDIKNYKLFKLDNLNVPSYARVLRDGTCRVIWRDIVNNGFNLSDDTVEEYPFTNGAFYVNRRVDLFLRRQDPENYWGLYTDDIEGNKLDIETEDNYVKDTEIVC